MKIKYEFWPLVLNDAGEDVYGEINDDTIVVVEAESYEEALSLLPQDVAGGDFYGCVGINV